MSELDLDAIERNARTLLKTQSGWLNIVTRESTSHDTLALVAEVRRLRADYDDLHELYGTVIAEQADQMVAALSSDLEAAEVRRDAAEQAVARVREYAAAWRHEHWAQVVLRALDGGDAT